MGNRCKLKYKQISVAQFGTDSNRFLFYAKMNDAIHSFLQVRLTNLIFFFIFLLNRVWTEWRKKVSFIYIFYIIKMLFYELSWWTLRTFYSNDQSNKLENMIYSLDNKIAWSLRQFIELSTKQRTSKYITCLVKRRRRRWWEKKIINSWNRCSSIVHLTFIWFWFFFVCVANAKKNFPQLNSKIEFVMKRTFHIQMNFKIFMYYTILKNISLSFLLLTYAFLG